MESAQKEFERLIIEKIKMIQDEQNKKTKTFKKVYMILELVLSLIGYGLIAYFGCIWLALGIFILTWANNMGQARLTYKHTDEWKEIWK